MAIARTITNTGLKELTKLHANITDNAVKGRGFSHIGIGMGNTTPMATDTRLQNEVVNSTTSAPKRKVAAVILDPVQTGDPEATTVMYVATWNPGEIAEGNDEVAITEIGLFNGASTGDVCYYRETRGVLTLSSTVGLTIKIRCRFSRIV
jgi:hypothetical protein